MSIQVCDCNSSYSNTGEVNCKYLLSNGVGVIAMPTFDGDGNYNEIDLVNDTLDQTYIDGKLNHSDPLKRWYPIMGLKNIEDTRGETSYESFDDDSKIPTADGIRNFHGLKPEVAPSWVGNVQSLRCGSVSVFIVGSAGELQGNTRTANKFRPFLVASGTWDAQFVKPKAKETSKLDLKFEFHQSMFDKHIGMITSSEFDDVNLTLLNGLLTVYSEILTKSTSALKVKLYGDQGTPLNPNLIKNLLAAAFSIYNVTQSSAIAFSGVGGAFAESPDGTYEFTYDTADQPAAGDVIRLTPTKNGYDFAAVVANTAVTV